MKIDQIVPAGKRLLVENADGPGWEFHGPSHAVLEVPDDAKVELVDEVVKEEPSMVTALRERELRVQRKDKDGKPLPGDVPEARGCPNADCEFYAIVAAGGEPCSKCRHLVVGDYCGAQEK